MTLTVSEKQHWKERIARKIAQATDALLARNRPDYLTEVAVQARREAIRALGIEELMRRRDELQESQKQLESDMALATRKLLAAVRGKGLDSVPFTYGWEGEIEQAIARRQQGLEEKLLAADELGRQILKLRREQEELLDTVWLATSPVQIRSLWQSVTDLLAGELTSLQQQALQSAAVESDQP